MGRGRGEGAVLVRSGSLGKALELRRAAGTSDAGQERRQQVGGVGPKVFTWKRP